MDDGAHCVGERALVLDIDARRWCHGADATDPAGTPVPAGAGTVAAVPAATRPPVPDPTGSPDADLVVSAGWVVTVDDDDTVVVDGSVAVAGDRIVAVGPTEAVLAAHPGVARVDLPGHALLPGLVNAHSHLAMTMFRGVADDRDLDAFLATVVPLERELLTPARVEVATRAAAVESVLAGVTTVLDMYFHVDAALAGAADVGLRLLTGPVVLGDGGPDLPGEDRSHAAQMRWAERWLERHPAGDGWVPVLGPHATYTVPPALLADVRDLAAEHRAVVHIHAAETAAECDLVRSLHGERPVELLADLDLLRAGTVLAHAVHLTDAELHLVAASGAAVAHCPASNLKLASGIARVPELVAAGVPVGLGTDGPASSNDLDVLGAVRLAALVHKATVRHGGGGDASLAPAAEVLRWATAGGAAALGLGDQLGSLVVGRRADLVAVDLDTPHAQPVHDPVSALVYAAGRGDVSHVWRDGRPLVADGEVVTVDRRAVVSALSDLGSTVAAATVA
jgi:5-methylthioadenosine/S-adenosylhomocysteine deaminase